MAPDDASDPGIRLKPMRPWCLPLPYVTELFPDELLSSWLRRTGTEYGVSLELLARHIGLLKTKPAEIDQDLSPDEIERLADAMRVERSDIRRRLHHPPSSVGLLAAGGPSTDPSLRHLPDSASYGPCAVCCPPGLVRVLADRVPSLPEAHVFPPDALYLIEQSRPRASELVFRHHANSSPRGRPPACICAATV